MKLTVYQLEQAILPNLCQPTEAELEKFSFEKRLRASPSMEQNSQIGLILFVGIARALYLPKVEIMDYLSINEDEYNYKLLKFKELEENGIWEVITNDDGSKTKINRFGNKITLVINYLSIVFNFKLNI